MQLYSWSGAGTKNLPKTYMAVDLKSDMLVFMRKNQEYIEVSVKWRRTDNHYIFSGIVVQKSEDLPKHDIRQILHCT